MRNLLKLLSFLMCAMFFSSLSYADNLTDKSVKSLISQVDKAIVNMNANQVAAVFSDNVTIKITVTTGGQQSVMNPSKQEYLEMLKEGWSQYGLGLLWVVISVALIALILDSILTKGLYFYPDRIEKRWLFGFKRSIAYANAKVIGPPNEYKWLTSAYTIRETNKDGKSVLWQLPILYISFFFPAHEQTKLAKIWEYLTQNKTDNPRIIKVPSICAETIQSL